MSRQPQIRLAIDGGLVVDCFAGGGGASTGIEQAIGRPVDIAINHDPVAIACHRANHPHAEHWLCDVWEVSPRKATRGRPVALGWFSPDCTHFSRARGDVPRSKGIRSLAWVVVRWARDARPAMLVIENVGEFSTWGPLDDEGYPVKERAGETFRAWLAQLAEFGYRIEFRELVAADFGAPTIRKRLYLVARLDGQNPVFPTPTHGKGRPNNWVPAHTVIDWALPCPSIFDRRRPLAEATMRRIAAGLRRYVIEARQPFLVGAVAGPSIIPVKSWGGGGNEAASVGHPVRTITASKRGEFALLAPSLVQVAHGEWGYRDGARAQSVADPVGVVTASNKFAVTAPYMVRHGHYSRKSGAGLVEGCGAGTFRGQSLEDAHSTVCATDDRHLVAPYLAPLNGEDGHAEPRARSVEDPHSTVMASSAKHMLAAPVLLHHYGGSRGQSWTVTAGGNRAGGHLAEVRAFLVKYYGSDGNPKSQQQSLFDPLHTVTAKARLGLVTIHGAEYQIVDIGMRMLQPHELFAAQGFPADYQIDFDVPGGRRATKTDQIRLAGNSVCPDVARAIVEANLAEAA